MDVCLFAFRHCSLSASAGVAATSVGKSILCAASAGIYTCLLSGLNENTIPNGVVAVVTATISPGTTSTSVGTTGMEARHQVAPIFRSRVPGARSRPSRRLL